MRLRPGLIACLCGGAVALAACNQPSTSGPGLDPPHGKERASDAGLPVRPKNSGAGGNGAGSPASGQAGSSAMTAAGASGKAGAGGRTGSAGAGAAGKSGSGAAGKSGSGASGQGGGQDAGSGTLSPDAAWFAGYWVVDQPTHADYEATLYEFGSDGAFSALDTMLTGPPPWPGFVTGSVAPASGDPRCVLMGAWMSVGTRRVGIDSSCGDGSTRRVVLAFPDGDPSTGLMPVTVESVDGESGWEHPGFPWSWRKCGDRSHCTPF